jgi:hypothetical protein
MMAANCAHDFKRHAPTLTKQSAKFCMICAKRLAFVRQEWTCICLCGDCFERIGASKCINCELSNVAQKSCDKGEFRIDVISACKCLCGDRATKRAL